MTHPHREFNTDRISLGYLITFRAYGTWLHGDSRGSVDRFHNRYGSPLIPQIDAGDNTTNALLNALLSTLPRGDEELSKWRFVRLARLVMETVGYQCENEPSSFCGDGNPRSGHCSECFQSQCNTQNEGVRLLAKR